MTSKTKNIVIHIGMPKAASSLLQNNFFTRLPLINFTEGWGNTISSKSFSKVIYTEDMYFNAHEISREILHNIDEKLPIVFSSELLALRFYLFQEVLHRAGLQ